MTIKRISSVVPMVLALWFFSAANHRAVRGKRGALQSITTFSSKMFECDVGRMIPLLPANCLRVTHDLWAFNRNSNVCAETIG